MTGTSKERQPRRRRKDRFLKVSMFTLWPTTHHWYHVLSMRRKNFFEKKKNKQNIRKKKKEGGLKPHLRTASPKSGLWLRSFLNDSEETQMATSLINNYTEKQENTGRKPYTNVFKVMQQDRKSNVVQTQTGGTKTRSTEPVSKSKENKARRGALDTSPSTKTRWTIPGTVAQKPKERRFGAVQDR